MELSGPLIRILLMEAVFAVPVGVYVHQDAEKRGKSRPLAWGVGFGLLALPGLLFYMALRD
ncbi:hypothetical protein [Halorussus amylolyticus]|uniref:hypothetical protein n=1 Tax=Halorussus amylolyticus TaxID=1126242 RepID=UPI001052200D|nr:hypothetical protein [Halorussus amylolyticus]